MPILLLLFIGVPIAEIALFIEVGDLIGLWPTLATVVVTAVVGTALVRAQGMATLARVRAELERDRLPVTDLVTGVCLLVAGALLLTPGFLTDAIGLSLLIPPLRAILAHGAFRYLRRRGSVHVHAAGGTSGGGPRGPRRGPDGKPIIDGEFEEVDPGAPARDDGPERDEALDPPDESPQGTDRRP